MVSEEWVLDFGLRRKKLLRGGLELRFGVCFLCYATMAIVLDRNDMKSRVIGVEHQREFDSERIVHGASADGACG